MVYRPQDPDAAQLYVVKREFAEEYETGHKSYIGPKLYLIGNAKSVCKRNNERRTNVEEQATREYWEKYYSNPSWLKYMSPSDLEERIEISVKHGKEELAKGPWIIAPAVVSCLTT